MNRKELNIFSFFPLCNHLFYFLYFFLYFYCCHYYGCPHFTPFCLSPPSPLLSAASSLWPSPHCCPCLWVMHICSLANPFTFFHLAPPTPTLSAVSLFYVSMPLFLFCSLDSTYKWDHMAFVFQLLAYFTSHNNLQVHPCCCKREDVSNLNIYSAEVSIHLNINKWWEGH